MLSTPGLFRDLIVQAAQNIRVSLIVLVHHLAKGLPLRKASSL